jgi:hypothetical protein
VESRMAETYKISLSSFMNTKLELSVLKYSSFFLQETLLVVYSWKDKTFSKIVVPYVICDKC